MAMNHGSHAGHDMPAQAAMEHGAHAAHDKHEGHSVAMFRDKFWISLLLTLPTLVWGHMLQQALGYTAPELPGSRFIPALFGTAVFAYGGTPFIRGAVRELKDRLPGMMTLISLAIAVAFVFSAAVTLGGDDPPYAAQLLHSTDGLPRGGAAGPPRRRDWRASATTACGPSRSRVASATRPPRSRSTTRSADQSPEAPRDVAGCTHHLECSGEAGESPIQASPELHSGDTRGEGCQFLVAGAV